MEMASRLRVQCPVKLCDGFADTHDDIDVGINLHTTPGKAWPHPTTVEWFQWIDVVMDATTYPLWALSIEVGQNNSSAMQAGFMAAEMNLNAFYINELNTAIVKAVG